MDNESRCVECGKKIPAGAQQKCKAGGLCNWHVPRQLQWPSVMSLVLMLNDWPIGVYASAIEAKAAAEADWKKREPRWEQQGLKLGESLDAISLHSFPFQKWHYWKQEFTVSAEARL